MKIKLSIITLLLGVFAISAQEVKIKKEKITLDGENFLKYEKINVSNHSVYDLDDNELLFVQFKDNETPQYGDDDFFVLNFINEEVKIESSDYSRIASFMNSRKSMQKLIKWLVKDKVLGRNGTIDPKRLDIFFKKYDEEITERTVRN